MLHHGKVVDDSWVPTVEELRALKKSSFSDYTPGEIKMLRKIQERMDNFKYTPKDSEGGLVPDDGTDPYFYYQSNLVPILDLLRSRDGLEDIEENADDDMEILTRKDPEKAKEMERQRIVASNIAQINEEKYRVQILTAFHDTLLRCQADTDIVDAVISNSELFSADHNVPVEGEGTDLSAIISMMQHMLTFRREQSNVLRGIGYILAQTVENMFTKMSSMVAAPPSGQETETEAQQKLSAVQTKEIEELRDEIESLKREQLFLYQRLYRSRSSDGGETKGDKVRKEALEKKIRKEVDEMFKQTVDREVAKKVAKAAKNSKPYVEKVQAELEEMRVMMMKEHLMMSAMAAPARTALNTVPHLEARCLELGDDAECVVSRIQPLDMTGEPEKLGYGFIRRHLLNAVSEMKAEMNSLVASQCQAAAEWLTENHMSPESIDMLSCGINEGAQLLRSTLIGSLMVAVSACSNFPPGIRNEVGEKFVQMTLHACKGAASLFFCAFGRNLMLKKDASDVRELLQKAFEQANLHPSRVGTKEVETQTDDPISHKGGSRDKSHMPAPPSPQTQKSPRVESVVAFAADPGEPRPRSPARVQSMVGLPQTPSPELAPNPEPRSRRKTVFGPSDQTEKSSSREAPGLPKKTSRKSFRFPKKAPPKDESAMPKDVGRNPTPRLNSTESVVFDESKDFSIINSVGTQCDPPCVRNGVAQTIASDFGAGGVSKTDRARSPSPQPLDAQQQQLLKDPRTVVAAGLEDALLFWDRCPQAMPEMIKMANQLFLDVLHQHHGKKIRSDGDAFLASFGRAIDAVTWALSVQSQLLSLPYPPSVLSTEAGAEIRAVDGTFIWRGFRVKMGMHMCLPVSVALEGDLIFDDPSLTLVARIALFACGGRIVASGKVSDALQPTLGELGSVTLRPAGEAGLDHGEPLRLFDVVDGVLELRHYPEPTPENSGAARAGKLFQWGCEYAVASAASRPDPVALIFLNVQSEADLPLYDPKVVRDGVELLLAETGRLVQKYRGTVVHNFDTSLMIAFPSILHAAQFAVGLQVRSVHLPFTAALVSFPECNERYAESVLIFRGLRIRMCLHYALPESTTVNRKTNTLQYYGSDVSLGAVIANTARFGETLVSESAFEKIEGAAGKLGNPFFEFLGPITVEGKSVALRALHPQSMAARAAVLAETDVGFPGSTPRKLRPILDPRQLREKPDPIPSDLEDFIPGNITFVLTCMVEDPTALIEIDQSELQPALNSVLDTIHRITERHNGHDAASNGFKCCLLFHTAIDALQSALQIQLALAEISYPPGVLMALGKQGAKQKATRMSVSGPEAHLFAGMCYAMGIHGGKIHASETPGLAKYYGVAFDQASFLATRVACPGEVIITQLGIEEVKLDPTGEDLLNDSNAVTLYQMEGVQLPGNQRRTGIFSALPGSFAGRRKSLKRGARRGGLTDLRTRSGRDMEKPQSPSAISGADYKGPLLSVLLNLDAPVQRDSKEEAHRTNARTLQRLFRALWAVAKKCGRVMGYPAEVDDDPVALDSALREAMATSHAQADQAIFTAEQTLLNRLLTTVADMNIALNCKPDKGEMFHRSQQSVIIVTPSEQNESALYEAHDLGAGRRVFANPLGSKASSPKRVGVNTSPKRSSIVSRNALKPEASLSGAFPPQATSTPNEAATNPSFRAGFSNLYANARLQERRMIALEKEISMLREQQHTGGASADVGPQNQSAPVPCRALVVPADGETVAVATQTSQRSLMVCQAGPLGTDPNRAATASLHYRPVPLSPLQTPYIPDRASRIRLRGEPSSDASLTAPFCKRPCSRGPDALSSVAKSKPMSAAANAFRGGNAELLRQRPHSSCDLGGANQILDANASSVLKLPFHARNRLAMHLRGKTAMEELSFDSGLDTTEAFPPPPPQLRQEESRRISSTIGGWKSIDRVD